MVKRAFILVACLSVAVSASADEVEFGGIPYKNVAVTGVSKCQLVFRTRTGTVSERALNELTRVTLAGRDAFNAAEQALADGEHEKAVREYDTARREAPQPWLKELIDFRRLRVLAAAGRPGAAVRIWQRLCRANAQSPIILAMAPTTPGAIGSGTNADAIKQLNAERPEADATAYDQAVTQLLMALYEAEGDTAAAGREAARLAGQAPPDADDGAGRDPGDGNVVQRLNAARLMLATPGRANEVVATVREDLHKYDRDLLPMALMVLAKGVRQQADAAAESGQEDEARQLKLEAGIYFMYVVTFFPNAPEAPESLVAAGQINEAIGNPRAAWQAYDAVRTLYPNTPQAQQAGEAAEQLEFEE